MFIHEKQRLKAKTVKSFKGENFNFFVSQQKMDTIYGTVSFRTKKLFSSESISYVS